MPSPLLRRAGPACAVLSCILLLTACAASGPGQPQASAPRPAGGAPGALQATADFYWPYAALAAEVYGAGDRPDNYTMLAFDSPSLRQEVRELGHAPAIERVRQLDQPAVQNDYAARYASLCGAEAEARARDAGRLVQWQQHCMLLDDRAAESLRKAALRQVEANVYQDATPADASDCRYLDHEPKVPVAEAIAEFRWTRLPEFHAEAPARGWSLFVPDLAIDVWRRPRAAPDGGRTLEYALVFRGTVGGGGWVSNVRGVTSFTPFVWDQYRQADRAGRTIIRRVQRLHALSDLVHERATPTRLLFTTVGHSLGAGLASYVHVLNPEVTRTVGFNPSPVDGGSMVQVGDAYNPRRPSRAVVNQQIADGMRVADAEGAPAPAAIFHLYEEGEVLSRFSACSSGPMWGSEGGPMTHCDSVNLSRGSWIRQHNMAQMACKLALARRGATALVD